MSDGIRMLTAADVAENAEVLAELLINAVDGGASVSYLAPMNWGDADAFWRASAADVAAGSRTILAAHVDGQVVGCVHVAYAGQPNAHHRAEIQKLLVHSDWRRRGLATLLMAAAEAAAMAHGRHLIVLDTQQGSGAELLYARLGYTRAGVIPGFALSSAGTYDGTVLFYKQLAEQ